MTAMKAEAERVQTIEVTHAVRDTRSNGLKVKKGDVIGLINEKLEFAGTDYGEVVNKALGKLGPDSYELVTVYRGEGASDDELQKLESDIRSNSPRAWRSRSSRAASSTTRSSFPSNSKRSLKRPFAVVTDSTADLPDEWRERYDIEVVPLKVMFGEESFRDGVDMNNEEFFAPARHRDQAAHDLGAFARRLRRAVHAPRKGPRRMHLDPHRRSLSATAEAARVGAQSVEGFQVNVIDSETVTMPMAFLCRVAAECATLDEATAAVEKRIPKCSRARSARHAALRRDGRQGEPRTGDDRHDARSQAAAAHGRRGDQIGRPRAHAVSRHPSDGRVLREGSVRSSTSAWCTRRRRRRPSRSPPTCGEALPDLEVPVGQIGCVLGTHVGPKALGLVYIKK